MHRTRWAAVGAAIAVALGAGGLGLVRATVSSGERTVYVAITPCRLFDTRPAAHDHVGIKPTSFGPDETATFATRGSNGQCTGTPNDATAVQLNVTALNATELTFLTIWPAGVPRPQASSLNPVDGQPPMPNAVTTDLNANGEFNVYNLAGTVDVLADVVGYYVDHTHDDRYYLKAEVDARLNSLKMVSLDVAGAATRGAAYYSPAVGNSGVVLPNDSVDFPGFGSSFTVPFDYTPNSPLTLELTWMTSQPSCGIALRQNSFTRVRPGVTPTQHGMQHIMTAITSPATAKQAVMTTFTIAPIAVLGIEPGDSINLSILRRADAPDDTCGLPAVVTGARIVYT